MVSKTRHVYYRCISSRSTLNSLHLPHTVQTHFLKHNKITKMKIHPLERIENSRIQENRTKNDFTHQTLPAAACYRMSSSLPQVLLDVVFGSHFPFFLIFKPLSLSLSLSLSPSSSPQSARPPSARVAKADV